MVPWPNVLGSLFQRKQTPQAINLHLLFPRLRSPESMSKYKICLLNMMRPSPSSRRIRRVVWGDVGKELGSWTGVGVCACV